MTIPKSFAAVLPLILSTAAVPHPPSGGHHGRPSIPVSGSPASGAGIPFEGFVSYSIEFSSFVDFAGNTSNPNIFSDNLLNNIRELSGTKPYIRVGGNTQDYAVFNKSQEEAIIGIYDPAITEDYPTTITIGPAFFDSYHTWPDTRYVHGFNLGFNSTTARQGLVDSASYACRALENGRLLYWELGNEPDLYKTSGQRDVRPPSWDEQDYVDEWLKYTREIRAQMAKACPELATGAEYKYYAPSFAGTGTNSLDPIVAWQKGLDTDKDIAIISSHNYISGAESPGVTLQGTLMNHSSTVASIAKQLNESRHLAALPDNIEPNLPFILGETNSLYNQGRPGLSNTFGAALWGVDFNLWCATNNIQRVHMHMGTNYRYQSWQPIDTDKATKGTKAPYYGNIAVAAFLGDITKATPSIVNLPLQNEEEAAYAAYVDGKLARIIVINMVSYNATGYNSQYINNYPRPTETYSFQLPPYLHGHYNMQRLLANGSDAISGVTFDGYSFNYELENGKPVLLRNVTRGEEVNVLRGRMSVGVPRSSAVIVDFESEQRGGGRGHGGWGHGGKWGWDGRW